MADSRIHALAATATSFSSGDFVAVDNSGFAAAKKFAATSLITAEIETASTATTLTVTQPSAATWQTILRAETADADAADFTWVLDGTPTFNGTRDNCLFYGYNVKTQGTRDDTDEPTLHFGLESNYEVTEGTHWMEYYSQFVSADGATQYRPYMLIVDRGAPTDGMLHIFKIHPTTSSSLRIAREDTDATLFTFVGNGVLGFSGVSPQIQFNSANPVIQSTIDTPICLRANATNNVYVSNAVEGLTFGSSHDTNIYRSAANTLKTDDKLIVDGELNPTAAFNHDGSTFGVLGVAPAGQRAHIADPTGGSADAEARTAINAILVTLETFGFHATS